MRGQSGISLRTVAGILALVLISAASYAQTAQRAKPAVAHGASAASERDWWKNAVIYEIYPRSFQDSNGDGIGDLNGITERLDYLQQLGVDAIWLTPINPSPQVDFGYDVSDYRAIDPQYGTLADFDRLVAEANKRHIRVILDMVMNHTSDKHAWFVASRSSLTNPYRDWYVWRDGKGETATDKGAPPNNWQSTFGHAAWQWDETTRQYYYHNFYVQQPDLNWNNPKVHEAFKDILRFWLDRGVAGFRFDAISTLYEDPSLADEAEIKDKDGKPILNVFGDVRLDSSKTRNLPGVHTVMQEMRAAMDTFNPNAWPGTRVLIGETFARNAAELNQLYGSADKPEFHLPMDLQVLPAEMQTGSARLDVAQLRKNLTDAETGIGSNIPLLVFDNHDRPRLDMRYGDGVHDVDIQKALATVLLMSRGAALFYYGDEIGMKTTPPTRKEDVKDPVGLVGWPENKGRDGERTPMQWEGTAKAGFTSGDPWLPVPPSVSTINVKTEASDPNSLLGWYKALIQLKKTNPVLAQGANVMLDTDNTKVLSWMRQNKGAPVVLVSVNVTAEPQTVSLKLPCAGVCEWKLKTLAKSPGAVAPLTPERIELGPYGVFIGEAE